MARAQCLKFGAASTATAQQPQAKSSQQGPGLLRYRELTTPLLMGSTRVTKVMVPRSTGATRPRLRFSREAPQGASTSAGRRPAVGTNGGADRNRTETQVDRVSRSPVLTGGLRE